MSLISELASTPGVVAAGEYSYRGDRFSFEGNIDTEQARLASIMCRATSMATHMQTDMLSQFAENCGCTPTRGWMVKGKDYTVCVMFNVFCFVDHKNASVNEVVKMMQHSLGDKAPEMI